MVVDAVVNGRGRMKKRGRKKLKTISELPPEGLQ
jgi:hypothetical protein